MERLLTANGVVVSRESLEARLADRDAGIVLSGGACASWVLDGGVMHVYDVVGDGAELGEIVRELDTTANGVFAAVLSAIAYDDDPLVNALVALGFAVDWHEGDVRAGLPARIVGLVREVS